MLKKLQLEKRKSILLEKKTALEEKRSGFLVQQDEIRTAIDEAKTEDDLKLCEERADGVESEIADIEKEVGEIGDEIAGIDDELKALDEKDKEADERASDPKRKEERKVVPMPESRAVMANKYETRSEMRARLERPDVRDFYAVIANAVKNRDVSGANVLVPEVIIGIIQNQIGDYSTLYSRVNVVRLSGEGRAILDGSIPEAVWLETCAELSELDLNFSDTEIDGYKVGGFISVCNANLEDSFINLANYIETRLAQAIAKSIDKAILVGDPDQNMPTGIIPSVPNANIVVSEGGVIDLLKAFGVIDDGEDGPAIDNPVAIMRRTTFYNRYIDQVVLPTAEGKLVAPKARDFRLPDGTEVVFSNWIPVDKVLIGDLSTYLLGERAGIRIEPSTHVQFTKDRTVFRGVARYDGKPVFPDKFVLVEVGDEADGEPDLDTMTKAQLIEFAADNSITIDENASKADILAAIKAAL